jgi:hypothetical protein
MGRGARSSYRPFVAPRCEECRVVADEAASGWRALHCVDPEDPSDAVLLVFYCPFCAQAEFGLPRPRRSRGDA